MCYLVRIILFLYNVNGVEILDQNKCRTISKITLTQYAKTGKYLTESNQKPNSYKHLNTALCPYTLQAQEIYRFISLDRPAGSSNMMVEHRDYLSVQKERSGLFF